MTIPESMQALVLPNNPKTLHWDEAPILWWALPDDMLPAKYRKERPGGDQGYPQTVKVTTAKETEPYTQELQEFNYALNPGLPRSAFADIMDTWNTGSKVRDNANFINHERETGPLPKLPTDLLFGCNVYRQVRRFAWGGNMGIPVGTDVTEIETIHPDRLPDPATLPVWLKQHLTIITPVMYQGRQRVNPFPHNGGRDGKPCYTGVISRMPVYIEVERLMPVVSFMPNPYYPEWKW